MSQNDRKWRLEAVGTISGYPKPSPGLKMAYNSPERPEMRYSDDGN